MASAPPPAVVQFRLDNGLCYLCGAKCFEVIGEGSTQRWDSLTINHEVHRGGCLRCQPLPLPQTQNATLGNGRQLIKREEYDEDTVDPQNASLGDGRELIERENSDQDTVSPQEVKRTRV